MSVQAAVATGAKPAFGGAAPLCWRCSAPDAALFILFRFRPRRRHSRGQCILSADNTLRAPGLSYRPLSERPQGPED